MYVFMDWIYLVKDVSVACCCEHGTEHWILKVLKLLFLDTEDDCP